VPGPELPPWERFQRFAAIISRVPKEEADKEIVKDIKKKPSSKERHGKTHNG